MKVEFIYASFENIHCCQLVFHSPSNKITSKKKNQNEQEYSLEI